MIKDFSNENKEKLKQMITDIQCNVWYEDIWDQISDVYLNFCDILGRLDIKKHTDEVEKYQKKLIDKNNTTLKELEKIFKRVYAIDHSYSKKLTSHIYACYQFNCMLKDLNAIIQMNDSEFSSEKINEILIKSFANYSSTFKEYGVYEDCLQVYMEYLRLSGIPEEDLESIENMIRNAEEPHKSIYLQSMSSYCIGDIDSSGYYSSGDNTINFNISDEKTNSRGAYTTFFHESGHAIDYNFINDGNFYSLTYVNENGQTLMDIIYEDVSNDVKGAVSRVTSNAEEISRIHDYIMGANSDDYDKLSKREKKILEDVQEYYLGYTTWYGVFKPGAIYNNEAASDVYGGMTNNIIHGRYTHPAEDGYWYQDGKATNYQALELWAEYYSYCATGNEDALNALAERFPTAKPFLDEMASSMVKK